MTINQKPMIYSQGAKRQLLSVDMAYALVLIYKDMLKNPPHDVMKIINEIQHYISIIHNKLYGGGKLILTKKDLKKYQKTIKLIQNSIDTILGTNPTLTLDFITGVIAIVSDQHDRLKNNKAKDWYVATWGNLVETLQKLYEYYDENIEYTEACQNGTSIEQAFCKILQEA